MSLRRAAAALTLVVVLACSGCGGDDQGETTAASTRAERQATTARGTAPQRETGEKSGSGRQNGGGKRGAEGSAPPQSSSGGGPTPGTKSVAAGVPTSPGGDNSIQAYGVEGGVPERDQAAAALRAFLSARAAGEWARACAQMSSGLKQSLRALVPGGGKQKSRPCPVILRDVTAGARQAVLRAQAQVGDILSFRAENDQAFLIFRGPDGVRYMPMAREDGAWKVGSVEPAQFFLGP